LTQKATLSSPILHWLCPPAAFISSFFWGLGPVLMPFLLSKMEKSDKSEKSGRKGRNKEKFLKIYVDSLKIRA